MIIFVLVYKYENYVSCGIIHSLKGLSGLITPFFGVIMNSHILN